MPKETHCDCASCERANSVEDMVQCDKCQKWFHYSCAGVNENVGEQNWECVACRELDETTIGSDGTTIEKNKGGKEHSNVGDRQSKDVDAQSGRLSVVSSGRSRRTLRLEMQRLEEERQIEEKFFEEKQKREQNYLKKKYELLALEEDELCSEVDSIHERTSEWVSNAKRSDYKKAEPVVMEPPSEVVAVQIALDQRHIAARKGLAKELPVFSGKPEEWPLFISSYENSTQLCGFSHDENLWRLQRSLKGKALEAVAANLLIPSNVPEVISTLRMLFGRPEYVVQMLLKKIRTEPPPKAERLETVINFSLSVRNLHSTMLASGLTSHLNNPILLQELIDKLPPSIRLNWAMNSDTTSQNLTQFSKWLFRMAEKVATVTPFGVSDGRSEKKSAFVHSHSQAQSSSGTTSRSNAVSGCYMCEKGHRLVECDRFKELTPPKKWDWIRVKNICERCLGHQKKFKCRSSRACGVSGCASHHHSLLHEENEAPETSKSATEKSCHAHAKANEEKTFFNVVPVVLYGKGRTIETFAFLDSGSSLTLVDEAVADDLQLDGEAMQLCLKWTAGTTRLEKQSRIVPIQISAIGGDQPKKYWLKDVRTVAKLALPVQSIDVDKLQRKYPHLRRLPLHSYKEAHCGILVGLNNQQLVLPQRVREGGWNDPVALKTRLGWCVSGCDVNGSGGLFHMVESCSCNKDLHDMVVEHYVLEDQCIRQYIESADDVRAKDILRATVKREDNAFSSGLLWKYDNIVLPESYSMALKRLKCLEKKASADETVLQTINAQIEDLVKKGYARKLTQGEIDEQNSKVWYLPIFIVTNEKKPGKVRLVWDAAASTCGVSLNSLLLKGPDELRLLTDVIQSFRMHRIAIAGDIEEMFHRVSVRKEDQQCQRFLWRFGEVNREPDVFVMQVLTFGATCSPSIAQHVKNTNAMEYADMYPRAAESIIQHHYVDDMLDSVDTVEEAIQLCKDVKHVHAQAGFNIRNWLSNSKEVLRALELPNDAPKTKQAISKETIGYAKVLGLWWNTEEDVFTFSLRYVKGHEEVLKGQRMPTKRELLRVLMSIYDPLGFLSFYLVRLKILLQEVWKSDIGWDEVVPDNLESDWESWRRLLSSVEDVRIPRCYIPSSFNRMSTVQLHIFVDASEDAMAAVAYFRYTDGQMIDCTLIRAKSKVAPLKPMSIPRLELQAALIGSRLADAIVKSHDLRIEKRFMWTDSRNVLSWLQADAKKLKQFVMFRVVEILENTKRDEWRWVPTRSNVADEATKWTKSPTFQSSHRWFKGPSFLYQNEEEWPAIPEVAVVQEEEIRPKYVLLIDTAVAMNNDLEIDVYKFKSWRRLHRAMAWVLRCINIFKGRRSNSSASPGILSTMELQQAKKILIQMAQRDAYKEELAALRQSKVISKSSILFKCSAYMDEEGVLRVKGRIDSAWCVEEDTKRPIIMPRHHRTTFLMVDDYHQRFHHRCQETVVNEFRQKYWVQSLRTLLRSVRRRCQRCRITDAVPMCPEMAPLPEARLAAYVRPFSYTGVDYFGPILIKVCRRTEKRWGVLFTCLTIRAVHLEVANSLTADSCIMCIRNFMSRRGTPREIYSDNGTNLRGAEKELREAYHHMDKGKIQRTFTSDETKWYFNPPGTPHMGGCWERLVGSVKSVLMEVTKGQRLQEESLRSMLIEVEGIVNSRPLTHVSVAIDDMEALTPNHFLLGSSSGHKPPGEFSDRDLLLNKSWRICQRLSQHFWERWVREYLPTLTRRTKWFNPVKNIEIGDLVIVVDENLPKGSWPKGVVIETVKAKDGIVRRATVRTTTGVYQRPAVKLAVLDVSQDDQDAASPEEARSVAKLAVLDVSSPGQGESTIDAAASPGGEMLLTHWRRPLE